MWKRFLHTILSGACRFQDRLHAAKITANDTCPNCNSKERGDAEHWNYYCRCNLDSNGKSLRDIEKFINEVERDKYYGNARAYTLKQLWSLPCLRLSGICPDHTEYKLPNAQPEKQTGDIAGLYALAASDDEAIRDARDIPGAVCETHNDIEYLCTYTDGSCLLPRQRNLAHAGWGVSIGGPSSSLKKYGALASTVQNSYRAELRAVAHTLAVCKCPVIIFCDCLAVVQQLNQYIEQRVRPDRTAAPELWEFVYDVVDVSPHGHIRICWIPSHLDDKSRKEKRQEYLANGTTTIQHIRGNCMADECAASGASMHFIDPMVLKRAEDRAQLTCLIQRHLVLSWSKWIDCSKKTLQLDIEHEVLPWESQNTENFIASEDLHPGPLDSTDHAVDNDEEDGYLGNLGSVQTTITSNEDPWGDDFGGMDIYGNDLPAQTVQVNEVPTDWITKVTGMQITNKTSVLSIARQLQVCYPKRRWALTPELQNGSRMVLTDLSKIQDIKKLPKDFTANQLHAVAWWLNRTPFSALSNTLCPGVDHTNHQCTYAEIATAVEIDTGAGIAGASADLAMKAQSMVTILRYIFSNLGVVGVTDRKKISFKTMFEPKLLKCTRDITGTWLRGISCRPIWDRHDTTEMALAANLCMAKKHLDDEHASVLGTTHIKDIWKLFGKGYLLKIRRFKLPTLWISPTLVDLHSLLMERVRVSTVCPTPCFFGHTITKNGRTQNLVPLWRGATLGSTLCNTCHRRMTHELNDPTQPLITENSQPPSTLAIHTPTVGPCVFGHTTSSAQGVAGKQFWHKMPAGLSWNGAYGGSVLCNACHVKFKRRRLNDSYEVVYDDSMNDDSVHQALPIMDTDTDFCANYKVYIAGFRMKTDLGRWTPCLSGLINAMLDINIAQQVAHFIGVHPHIFLCKGFIIAINKNGTGLRFPSAQPARLHGEIAKATGATITPTTAPRRGSDLWILQGTRWVKSSDANAQNSESLNCVTAPTRSCEVHNNLVTIETGDRVSHSETPHVIAPIPNKVADDIPLSCSAMLTDSDVVNFQCDDESFESKRRRLLVQPLHVLKNSAHRDISSC